MTITRIEDDSSNNDFFIEGDHARMSYRKVAEITKVTHKTVSNWVDNYADATVAEKIKTKGFDMATFTDFVYYVATAKRVSKKVREHCIKLLYEMIDAEKTQEMINNAVKGYYKHFLDRPKENLFKNALVNDGSFIYLIQNLNTGNLKIGYSVNPCRRFNDLQQSTDCELRLLAFFEGTVEDEQVLLNKYAKYSIRGEWFKPVPEMYLDFGLTTEFINEVSK